MQAIGEDGALLVKLQQKLAKPFHDNDNTVPERSVIEHSYG